MSAAPQSIKAGFQLSRSSMAGGTGPRHERLLQSDVRDGIDIDIESAASSDRWPQARWRSSDGRWLGPISGNREDHRAAASLDGPGTDGTDPEQMKNGICSVRMSLLTPSVTASCVGSVGLWNR
jgi:hypothetical protein